MPQFAHNPETGQVVMFDDQIGQWRAANRAEIDIEQSGLAGQVEAGIEGATGVQSLLGLAIPEFAERAEALTGGNTAAAVTGAAATLGLGSAAALSGRAAGRVQQKVAANVAQRQTRLKTSQGFIRPAEEMLPAGAQGGGRIVRAGIETSPVTRVITDYLVRNPNQKNMNRLAARAIGVTDDELKMAGGKLTDEIVGIGHSRISKQFDEVGDRITANLNNNEVTKLALKLNADDRISNAKLAAISDDVDRAGRNLMDMRSQLNTQMRREKDIQLKNKIQNNIDEIDKIIEKAVGDDQVTGKLYADARARYRASLALDKGVARSAEDNINVPSLNTALKQIYGSGITKGKLPQSAPADVRNFIEGARQARGVNVGVPTSGTAERLIAANMLGLGVGSSF